MLWKLFNRGTRDRFYVREKTSLSGGGVLSPGGWDMSMKRNLQDFIKKISLFKAE